MNIRTHNPYDQYLSTHFSNMHNAEDFAFSLRYFRYNFLSFLPKDKQSRFLDIGCGTGHFLHNLDGMGYKNYIGIDVSKEQVEYCRNHITKKVLLVQDTQKFLKKHNNEFDFILMNDVIEHLPKDEIVPILSCVYESLKSNGKIVIKTANLKNRWGMAVRYMDFTHTVGFTEESLRQVMRLAGFTNITLHKEIHPIHNLKSFVRVKLKSILELIYRLEYLASFGTFNVDVGNMLIAIAQK